jgi:hypothetical protein
MTYVATSDIPPRSKCSPSRPHGTAGMIPGMGIAFAVFGVAFAAFCLWLTVRIINRRERWAKRTLAVTFMLPVLYVVSFGPASWLASWDLTPRRITAKIYYPILHMAFDGPRWVLPPLAWYTELGEFDHGSILPTLYWETWL